MRLLGHVDDVRRFFGVIDCFVLSSTSEGLPNVMLEAMAMKVPVVATRVGGIPSLVNHEQNGIVVEPGSVQELEKGIRPLIDNVPLRRALADAARRTIEQSYSFDQRMRRVTSIYDRLLGRIESQENGGGSNDGSEL